MLKRTKTFVRIVADSIPQIILLIIYLCNTLYYPKNKLFGKIEELYRHCCGRIRTVGGMQIVFLEADVHLFYLMNVRCCPGSNALIMPLFLD